MEGYLPETYFTSNNCYHILIDKHFEKREGRNIPLGNLYNYCPYNKKFKEIFDKHIATPCSDSYFEKYASILTCDCEATDTLILLMKINLKSCTCIYHEAISLYLIFMCQDYFDTSIKLKNMSTDSSSDCEVLEVKMVPNEGSTPTKSTSGIQIDSLIPKKAKSKKNIITQKKIRGLLKILEHQQML